MIDDALIYVPVWLALVGWFVGSFARSGDSHVGNRARQRVYCFAWLFGSVMITLHILASYGLAYGWSHAAAIAATAKESERVTGIRAGWGVYVNLAFAAIWMGYSTAMAIRGRRWQGIDRAVFWFTAAIVLSATVIFETGPVRWLSVAGFIGLMGSLAGKR
ncbi:hypothetical protein Mal15_19790 [Stieleria maiorica]|uniref:Uncharacterized protein n=1 Tax=Stieleria maiorica TaxID=2795974 RepID=A0A5B9MB31_9BACT|nr:hypothetical protein [Stieleria maiorica]QEF97933.1 hypothetical protein Mal15_19790 [Stieleria maiorica]